jgi:hypothetical protein
MFHIDFILIALFMAQAVASVWRAPKGYEDENGFHYA